jgi:hypothetical protein
MMLIYAVSWSSPGSMHMAEHSVKANSEQMTTHYIHINEWGIEPETFN